MRGSRVGCSFTGAVISGSAVFRSRNSEEPSAAIPPIERAFTTP